MPMIINVDKFIITDANKEKLDIKYKTFIKKFIP